MSFITFFYFKLFFIIFVELPTAIHKSNALIFVLNTTVIVRCHRPVTFPRPNIPSGGNKMIGWPTCGSANTPAYLRALVFKMAKQT